MAAWNALPAERQAELKKLKLLHSYAYFMATREFGERREISEELKAENPDVVHPLIRTHPADGRKALWPSTGTVKAVIGMPGQAGLDLLDDLVDFMTQDRFVYRHKWREGDIPGLGQPLHPAHRHPLWTTRNTTV